MTKSLVDTVENNIHLINLLLKHKSMSTDPFDEINDYILIDLLVENEYLKDELSKSKEYSNLEDNSFVQIKSIEKELFGNESDRTKYNWFSKTNY